MGEAKPGLAWPGPPWEKPPWWWKDCSPVWRERYLRVHERASERAERARRPRKWPLYIRFGNAPGEAGGRKRRSLAETRKTRVGPKLEKGVSVFRGRLAEDGAYVVATPNVALGGMFLMCAAEGRTVYLAEGREVALGSDAEPVLEASSLRLEPLPPGTRLRRSNDWAHRLNLAFAFAGGLQTGRLGGFARWWAFDGEIRVGDKPEKPAPAKSLAALAEAVLAGAALAGSPVHGEGHWCRTAVAGAYLAEWTPGVDALVVFLHSLMHDSRRVYDSYDAWHGWRAARLARGLIGDSGLVSADQLDTLAYALEFHDEGLVSDDPTVGACWDADRLCLWRVGKTPDPRLLSTEAAKSPGLIGWARELQGSPVSWHEACQRLGLREPEHLAMAEVLGGAPPKPATLEEGMREGLRRWGVPDEDHERAMKMVGFGSLMRGR